MKFKVQAGASETLCSSCSEGVVSVRRDGSRIAMCHVGMSNRYMPPDIVHCTDFEDRRLASRWEMEKVAWMVKADKHGKVIGFEAPKKKDDD